MLELIDNRGALVLKILTDVFLLRQGLYIYIYIYILIKRKKVAHEKERKKRGQ